jgi:hypothetical protein
MNENPKNCDVHKNCDLNFFFFFSKLEIYSGNKAGATKFVTSGIDGRLVIWDIKVYLSCAILIYELVILIASRCSSP